MIVYGGGRSLDPAGKEEMRKGVRRLGKKHRPVKKRHCTPTKVIRYGSGSERSARLGGCREHPIAKHRVITIMDRMVLKWKKSSCLFISVLP